LRKQQNPVLKKKSQAFSNIKMKCDICLAQSPTIPKQCIKRLVYLKSQKNQLVFIVSIINFSEKSCYPGPGSLDKKGGRRLNLLLGKRLHLLPPFYLKNPAQVINNITMKYFYLFFLPCLRYGPCRPLCFLLPALSPANINVQSTLYLKETFP
jgi:hypothetical protein